MLHVHVLFVAPLGAMYLWAKIPVKDSMEFTKRLWNKSRVLVTPGIAYGDDVRDCIRIGLVHDKSLLVEAAEAIPAVCDDIYDCWPTIANCIADSFFLSPCMRKEDDTFTCVILFAHALERLGPVSGGAVGHSLCAKCLQIYFSNDFLWYLLEVVFNTVKESASFLYVARGKSESKACVPNAEVQTTRKEASLQCTWGTRADSRVMLRDRLFLLAMRQAVLPHGKWIWSARYL